MLIGSPWRSASGPPLGIKLSVMAGAEKPVIVRFPMNAAAQMRTDTRQCLELLECDNAG
jgi:hypothetical protein